MCRVIEANKVSDVTWSSTRPEGACGHNSKLRSLMATAFATVPIKQSPWLKESSESGQASTSFVIDLYMEHCMLYRKVQETKHRSYDIQDAILDIFAGQSTCCYHEHRTKECPLTESA